MKKSWNRSHKKWNKLMNFAEYKLDINVRWMKIGEYQNDSINISCKSEKNIEIWEEIKKI